MLKNIISSYRHELRMWMRERTKPISVEEAQEKNFFWAKVYALTCFGILLISTHRVYNFQPKFNKTDDTSEELRSSFIFTTKEPVRVVKFKGLSKVSDVTYSAEELSALVKNRTEESSNEKDSAKFVAD